jgi:hypothetical protein
MTGADIWQFLTGDIFWLFFLLPFVAMFVAMLAQMSLRSKSYAGDIPWDDTQREAYIGGVIAAAVTVAVTLYIGGPEPFVLFWRPLITTVIVLPLGFAAALFVFAGWRKFKS